MRGLTSARTLRGHIDAWRQSPIGAEKAINVELPVLEECVQQWQRAGLRAGHDQPLPRLAPPSLRLGQKAKKAATMPSFPRLAFENAREATSPLSPASPVSTHCAAQCPSSVRDGAHAAVSVNWWKISEDIIQRG